MGVETVCFFPASTDCSLGVPYSAFPPIWIGPGRYDFASLDKQVEQIRQANPKAKLLCMIDLNTPHWWVRLHGRRSGCCDTFYQQGRTAATDVWRKETREYLRAFLGHMEKRHAPSVAGYILACGATTEWQDCSHGEESASRRAAWRAWMKANQRPDPVDIPPASLRERTTHGIFRDPVKDRLALDYWRFNSWLTGDAILFFAGAVQEVIDHRVPIGIFYGYVLEHARGRLLYEGHLDFDRVFRSKDLDFFLAPGPYFDRQIGGGSGFMTCTGSLRLYGKGCIREIDHRTHTSRSTVELGVSVPGHRDGFPDEKATIAGLRREFSLSLIEGTSLWWFDMFGGWYEGQAVISAIEQMRTLWQQHAPRSTGPAAEVAVLVDAESMVYVDGMASILPEFLYRQRAGLARMGAPYEVFSVADLATLDLSKHKLILLPNLFVVDAAKRDLLRKKVCRGDKTVVWVYAPGVIADGVYDRANIEKLTGIRPDVTELTERKMDGWTSVFAPKPNLPSTTLRKLARDAGVHIYSDAPEPLYANEHLLAAHSLKGGKRTFELPRRCRRITELFTHRVVAENATRFSDSLAAPSTVLYALDVAE